MYLYCIIRIRSKSCPAQVKFLEKSGSGTQIVTLNGNGESQVGVLTYGGKGHAGST